jgi:hypothetical protein
LSDLFGRTHAVCVSKQIFDKKGFLLALFVEVE